MKKSGIVWNEKTLNRFLTKPLALVPGSSMTYDGVPEARDRSDLIAYQSGNSVLNVFRSAYAGTNQATAVCWAVGGELDGLVQSLKAKGVVFEYYDLPEITHKGDIHLCGDMKVVWFKDPDGNILNLINR